MAESYIDIWVGSNNITSSWFDSSIVSNVYQTNPDDYDQGNKIFRLILNRSATSLSGMFKDKTYVYRANIYLEEDSRVTDLSYMFDGCHQFERCGGYVKSPVTTTAGMFRGCASYSESNSPSFTVSLPDTILDMSSMFYNNYYLTSCPSCISSGCTKNVTNMANMFGRCWNFKTSSRLEGLDVSSCTNFNSMFAYGSSASNKPSFGTVNLSKWKIREDATTDYMFRGANVTRVYFPPMKTYGKSIFQYNSNMAGVDMYSVIAPTISEYAFEGYPTNKTMFVPQGSTGYDTGFWKKLTDEYGWTIVAYDDYGGNYIKATYTWTPTGASSKTLPILGDTSSVYAISYDGIAVEPERSTSQYRIVVSDNGSKTVLIHIDPGTTYLGRLFINSTFLSSVDGSMVDVSAVTDMHQMFYDCWSLSHIELSTWNVSKLREADSMFQDCTKLTDISSLYNWNLSSSEWNPFNGVEMFYNCGIKTINCTWNLPYASLNRMFESCDFETAVLKNWDIHNAQVERMFMWCDKMTSIDCSGWNTSGITWFHQMFSNTYLLKDVIGFEDWDTSSVTNMGYMFAYAGANAPIGGELDLSSWNMRSIAEINDSWGTTHMFISSGFRVIKLPYFPALGNDMFNNCSQITDLYIYSETPITTYESDFFKNIKTYGTLHYTMGTTGFNNYPWDILYNNYHWNMEVISTIYNLNVPVEGGTFTINQTNTGSWSVTSYPEWAVPPVMSGSGDITFNLTIGMNGKEERSGEVVIQTEDIPFRVKIKQVPLEIQWDIQPAGTSSNSGTQWAASLYYNLKPETFDVTYPSWTTLHYTQYDDYIQFIGEIEPAGGKVDRSGNINVMLRFNNEGEINTITEKNFVYQNGEEFTFYPATANVDPIGGMVLIGVTSQYPLTGYKSAISSVAHIEFERKSDTEIELYAYYPMASQGVMDTIMLIGDEGFNNIPLTVVTQSKFELVWEFNQDNTLLSTDSTPEAPNIDYVFGVVGYESSVDITDMTFTVDYLNGDDWITEITCDTDWQEVHIKAKDNRLGGLRRATITARSEQYEAAREFEVVQEGLSLYVYPTSGTIETNGGSVTFGVNDANVGWIGPDEIVISLDGENVPFTYKQHSRTLEVTIQVPANDSDQSRTLYYEVLAYTANPAASATYAVTQSAFEWNMLDSLWIDSTATTPDNQTAKLTDEIEYSSLDNLGTLEVTFDADWIQATGQSWIMGAGIINVAVEDNRLGSLRRCTMTIYSPTYNKTKTVTIVQQGFSMSNQNSGYTIDCAGGDVTLLSSCNSWIGQDEISIKGQINGTLVDLPFTINGGYITQNYTDVYVTLPSNAGIAREIEIQMHILALGNYFIFNVDQPSCDINIDTPEIHFEKEGGSREVYIEATGNWQVEVVGDWITVTPMNGSGEDVIEISVDPNNTQSDRTGYVYITNGIEREAIVITQGHIIPELYLKERYIKMPLEGGTIYVTLISNIDWTTEWEIQ